MTYSNGDGGMSVERKIVNDEIRTIVTRPLKPRDHV